MQNFFSKFNTIFSSPNSSRYYTGLVLIGVVSLIIILNIKFLSWAMLGVCYLLAVGESMKLQDLEGKFYLYVASAIIWLMAYFYKEPILLSLIVLLIIASYNVYMQEGGSKDYFVILYPTIPFLCLFEIYTDFEVWAIIWLIVTVAITDIAAYFGGRVFGKTPLSPVSPKKTLEGALIGLVFAMLMGSIIGIVVVKSFITSFFITLCVSVFSIFGDLFESMLKRRAGVKDSGGILPGHGGMLDRVDGLLFGAVVMVFLLKW